MSRLEDEDGIDGPFNRAMARADRRTVRRGSRATAGSPVPEITAFAPLGDGTRNRAFSFGGCNVLVSPSTGVSDDTAARLTAALASIAAGIEHRFNELELKLADASARALTAENDIAAVRAKVPPKRPERLLDTGYVRFLDGRLFLLNRRERGFGEFGVEVDGWDDLFRRYDVKVTAHGIDEHGAWWAVSA